MQKGALLLPQCDKSIRSAITTHRYKVVTSTSTHTLNWIIIERNNYLNYVNVWQFVTNFAFANSNIVRCLWISLVILRDSRRNISICVFHFDRRYEECGQFTTSINLNEQLNSKKYPDTDVNAWLIVHC